MHASDVRDNYHTGQLTRRISVNFCMKKDIPRLKVKDLAIGIVPPAEPADTDSNKERNLWDVYLINLKHEPIHNVLIRSQGYGKTGDDMQRTSTLRYFFEHIPGETAVLVEPIDSAVFHLANEYWISFTFRGHMYDKKYIFVRGSISRDHFTHIPIVDRNGVMIV